MTGIGGLNWVLRDGAYIVPGVPAVGHITLRGYWHPGGVIANCTECQEAK